MEMNWEHAKAVKAITKDMRKKWPNVDPEDKLLRSCFASALERLKQKGSLGRCDSLGKALIDAKMSIKESDLESADLLLSQIIEEVHTFELIRYGALQLAAEHLDFGVLRNSCVWRSPAEAISFDSALSLYVHKGYDSELPANTVSSPGTPITTASSCTLSDEEHVTPEPDHEDGLSQLIGNDCAMEENDVLSAVAVQATPKDELRNKLSDMYQKLDEFDAKCTQKLDLIDAKCDKSNQTLKKMEETINVRASVSDASHVKSAQPAGNKESSMSAPTKKITGKRMKYPDESDDSSDSDTEISQARKLKKRRESVVISPHRSRYQPIPEKPKRDFNESMSFDEIKMKCKKLRAEIYETRVIICHDHFEEYVEGEAVVNSCCNFHVMRMARWNHEALIEGHMKLADEHGEQSLWGSETRRDRMHAQREMWHLQDVLRLYEELSPW